jgi:hypothetical protein
LFSEHRIFCLLLYLKQLFRAEQDSSPTIASIPAVPPYATHGHRQHHTKRKINWFKRLCLPMEFQNMTLKTLRSRLLLTPGELTKSKNRPALKLPANFLFKGAFEYAIKRIEK